MHLKLNPDPRFVAEVTAMEPTLDGPVEVTFKARFKAMSFAAMETYAATGEGNERFLREVLVGADVAGDDDQPLAWSDELRDRLIDTPWLRTPLITAYRRTIVGAARGN